MVLRLLLALVRLILHVFYRDVEVEGLERVPPAPQPAIFVLNHPNGLMDPLFVLGVVPRRVAFLAKSTLFGVPLLGAMIRGLGCVPVYRQREDGEDPRKNTESFERARALLASGGTLAIFPEGTSHSDPALRPLKTGAARIALGARAGLDALAIVPAGLYYSEKQTFRSRALVVYGEPVLVPAVDLDDRGEPPRAAVRALTEAIERALRAVTLNATDHDAHEAVDRAARILAADEGEERPAVAAGAVAGGDGVAASVTAGGAGPDLASASASASASAAPPASSASPRGRIDLKGDLALRRRIERGYALLRAQDPRLLDALERRLRRYERKLAMLGLEPSGLRARYPLGAAALYLARELLVLALLLPAATFGALVHWVPYRLTGILARRFAESDDVLATYKALSALLLFPLAWCAVAGAAAWKLGWTSGLVALALCPVLGWAAMRAQDLAEELVAAARAFVYYARRRAFLDRLVDERRAIREALRGIERGLSAASVGASTGTDTGTNAPAPAPASPPAPASASTLTLTPTTTLATTLTPTTTLNLALACALVLPVASAVAAARARADDPPPTAAPPGEGAARIAIEVDAATGAVTLDVDAPVLEVLDALRAKGSLQLMADGGLDARVALRAEASSAAVALRLVAAHAGLIVEERSGPLFLVRRPRATDTLRIDALPGGVFRVPDRFAYDLAVLADDPPDEDARRSREALARLELTRSVSLTVSPETGRRVAEEYNLQRDVYLEVLARAGLRMPLPRLIEPGQVRVYLELDTKTAYLAEVLLDGGAGSRVHVVYAIEAGGRQRFVRLILFRTLAGG